MEITKLYTLGEQRDKLCEKPVAASDDLSNTFHILLSHMDYLINQKNAYKNCFTSNCVCYLLMRCNININVCSYCAVYSCSNYSSL